MLAGVEKADVNAHRERVTTLFALDETAIHGRGLTLSYPFGGHIPAAESSARRASSRASATL